ncbi:MAG: glycosyltransferase [Thermoguttaceae bacterium]
MFVRADHSTRTGGLSPARGMCLSLCMIVRDNARTLGAALTGIRPWVDEIVVVDTGSRDETPAIAAELGARLFHFPWCDDFSAARNESLRHARGEWLFWMDSDDTIDAGNGRRLRELAHAPHEPGVLGYVVQVRCPGHEDEAGEGETVVDHIKLFRSLPQLRFEFRIHEQVLPAIRRLRGQVAWSGIHVVHSGADQTPQGRCRKYERDLRILDLELRERPDHPFVLFNLGMTRADMGEHEAAVGFLRRCLQVSDASESHVRKAYALLVASLGQLGRQGDAWEACRTGREIFPDDPELLFRHGMLAQASGRLREAEQAYRQALADRDARHFSSIDPGILGHKARHNLALVYQEMGRCDLAEVQWRETAAAVPGFRPGRRSLVDVLIRQGKLVAAEIEVESMLAEPLLAVDTRVLSARVAEARGSPARAMRVGAVRVRVAGQARAAGSARQAALRSERRTGG